MESFVHVAIDGPAGSGKTTVAKAVARRLRMLYLDTGAMYRAVAWLAIRERIDPADADALSLVVGRNPISVVPSGDDAGGYAVLAGGVAPGAGLFSAEVNAIVSTVAAQPRVRETLVESQRAAACRGPVVMAGRDIGTVVLPLAPVKVFLTASLERRAERRREELARSGVPAEIATVRAELGERDRLDGSRDVSPLRPAPDAVLIDSTNVSVEGVVERIAALAAAVR